MSLWGSMSELTEVITEAAAQAGMSPLDFAARLIERSYEITLSQNGVIDFVPKVSAGEAIASALVSSIREVPRDERQPRVYLNDDGSTTAAFGASHRQDGSLIYDEKKRLW